MDTDAVFDDLVKNLTADEIGKELYERGKDILLPFLQVLAEAKLKVIAGETSAEVVVESMGRAVKDVSAALSVHAVNRIKESIEGFFQKFLRLVFF